MKILFLISSLEDFGGTERVVVNLANDLSNKNDVTIVNRNTEKVNSAYHIDDKVEVYALTGSLLVFRRKLKRFILENGYKFVVIHNMGKLSLLVASLNLPNSIILWSYEHVARDSRPKWVNFLAKRLYKKISKIITISANDAKSYLKIGYKTTVMYNPSSFDISREYSVHSKKIISIGRFTHQKGFDSLLMAWSLLADLYPEWQLEIYGHGEDKEKLSLMIKKNKLKNVSLLPPISNINSVYQTAAFYVMSSRYEGLPMVLIEAQTFSLPIISFDCPHGPSEILTNNFDGMLVEDQNIQKLAEAIEFLILNPEKRKQFSHNAIIAADRFSREKIIKQWMDLLGDIPEC